MSDNNNLRMTLKAALDNLWSRISGIFGTVNGRIDDAEGHIDDVESELTTTKGRVTSVENRMTTAEGQITGLNTRVGDLEDAVDDLDGAMIKSITFNGTAVPKDAQGNVALQETDPTVPAWAKQAKAKTSDLTNDGDDGINPFITALNLPNNTSDLTNDGDGDSPFATLQQMQAAVAGQYALIDLQTKSQTSWLTIQEMWDELKKVPIKQNRAFTADANCSDLISGGETLTLEGIIYPHAMNYTDTIDRYYYMAFDGSGAKIYLGEFNIGRHPVSGEYLCECLEIHTISDSGGGGGGSGAVNTVTFNGVTHQPDSNGNVTFGFTETDPSVPSWAKAAQKPSYTAAEVGAKPIQTAVADPTASGNAVSFIDSITQNANGVITPTKKTVRSASQSESGLMSATDKTKLDGIAAGAQVNSITGVKGDAESSYRTGNVNLTPANIGAHPARANLQVTNNSSYTGTPAAEISQPIVQILDSSGFIRHQMYGLYSTIGNFYTYIAARRPSGSSAVANQIGIGFDANGNGIYSVTYPKAFRSEIGLGNVNNSLVLTATTGAALYEQLNALPVSPANGAGVTCYINNPALQLLTGKTDLSSSLHGIITRTGSTRFRVFGMYGDTGYIMYWTFDITSAGAITPLTVYKLQGTAM